VEFPANAMTLFGELIKIVTFDFLDLKELFGVGNELELDFTPTGPFNANFDSLGYGSQNTIDNMGTLNFIILAKLLHFLIFCLMQCRCCQKYECSRNCRDKHCSSFS